MTEIRELQFSRPDFAALYERNLAEGGTMTPRMACWLWLAALFIADTLRCFPDQDVVDEHLPRIARPYARGRWLEEFITGFDRLAERIAVGEGDTEVLAQCTAEELALHEIIDLAEALVIDEVIDVNAAVGLPDYGVDDQDFDSMRDLLFEDHDVLMLFNPALDGVEDDPGWGTANLHPLDWFKPFRG